MSIPPHPLSPTVLMTKVTLHLYDLSNGIARSMSQAIIGKQLDGIWHSGIVVFGVEYFYGGGICAAPAGHAIPHLPYQEIALGETNKTQIELEFFLQSINHRFTQATYSLLRHNCNNFANEVAQFLLAGKGIPEHIIRLPQEFLSSPLGATLAPMIEQMENQMRQQLVGGGSGLNPFGHIQTSVPAIPSSTAAQHVTKKTFHIDGERKLLETAINGIPGSIMDDETKRKVLEDKVDRRTMEVLVEIIQKNCNVNKNPILMSFGTIARFMVHEKDFRKPLLPILGDILITSLKSDNAHVVNTGLLLGVNLSDAVDKDDVKVISDPLFGTLLNAVMKIDPSLETLSETQKRIALYTTNNLLVHFVNEGIEERMDTAHNLIKYSISLLDSEIICAVGRHCVVGLANALEKFSSEMLSTHQNKFVKDGIDTETVVRVVEKLETVHQTVLSHTLQLVLE